jgi:hypothetical protein
MAPLFYLHGKKFKNQEEIDVGTNNEQHEFYDNVGIVNANVAMYSSSNE